MNRGLKILRSLLVCIALTQTFAAFAGVTAIDARGKAVTFERSPQRIVSVLPSLTESVCVLGACDRLVGVDRYSNWPEQVKKLPQVGGGLDLNIEAIIRLKPDVVLAATSSRAGERLEQLGIKVLMFEPASHEQVKRSLMALDAMLGTSQASSVWAKIERDLADAAKLLSARSERRSGVF
ncbi:MAG: ABC transporter substrate-binding protein [Brachymonas sp.]|nr:ABC transporter substrate-binding protein [Brachymonas sp.]